MMWFLLDVKIILAFGNYMNSSKRGAAHGFRLQSLDLVSKEEIRTTTNALHVILKNRQSGFDVSCFLSAAVGNQIYRP